MRTPDIARIAALAIGYAALARLGLSFATVGRSVTLVWPPTGLALAGLLMGGQRLWPGVTIAAFAVNVITPGVPWYAAAGMAAGNTFEAMLGAALLRRAGFDRRLERLADVLRLAALAAGASTLVSAAFGVTSLVLAGLLPWAAAPAAGLTWWVGDALGALVVAPVLLAWPSALRARLAPRRVVEAAALLACQLTLTRFAFGHGAMLRSYMVFPLLVWAGLRFGPPLLSLATFITAAVAVAATVTGAGPFATPSLAGSLMASQTFIGVVALTSLALGAAIAERRRALQVRDDFIALASHELRTPLTTLRLQLQRALGITAGKGAEARLGDVTQALRVLERQVDRIGRLSEDLLDATHIRAGLLRLEVGPVDMRAVVDEVVEGLRGQAAAAACALIVEPGPSPVGQWDKARLQQVLSNLIGNALKFGQGAPVTIRVETCDDGARLSVSDQGIGIDEADHALLFERFARAASVRNYAGLGLGLFIARQIVEAHGGSIRVDSRPGLGATFTVALPLGSAARP